MKKIISILLCCTLLTGMLLCFAGCGAEPAAADISGKYVLSSIRQGDQTASKEQLEAMLAQNEMSLEDFTIELKSDGTAIYNTFGIEQHLLYGDGKLWSEENPDIAYTYSVDGDLLTVEQDGAQMIFQKTE